LSSLILVRILTGNTINELIDHDLITEKHS
jgi:hypothetical protein